MTDREPWTTMRPERLLIADDQEDVLTALALLLKAEGMTADFVESPSAVLPALSARRYDLLLLDMNYTLDTTSGSEGLELLSRIRRYDSTLPVVLMTAWSNVELAVRAMRRGSADFIQKPWDNDALIRTIRRNLASGGGGKSAEATLAREGREAHEIQRGLFPAPLPRPESCEIHGTWHPVQDVGGDYYDAIALGHSSVALCIGDVSGKGLPAALLMANVQAAVRTLADIALSPSEVCRRLNGLILENTPSDKFVTFFYAVLDTSRRTLRYSNAGHLPPFLVRPDGAVRKLSEGGSLLGVVKDAVYEQAEVRFAAGDRLVLYTDGLTEARNVAGEEFGDRRLSDLARHYLGRPLTHFHDALLSEVRAFAGSLQDDAAVLTVACNPAGCWLESPI